MPIDPAIGRRDAIARKIQRERRRYPVIWARLIGEWRGADRDAAWLTYSANYLLHTAGVRWGLDPFSLLTRVGGEQPDFVRDLAGMELVVLTHAHSDHIDEPLLSAIRDFPLTWLIPDFLQKRVIQVTGLPPERILTPRAGHPIVFGGLRLTPFNSLHLHPEGGLPEMGYLAEFNGKRWLFPGDIRTYDAGQLPVFGRLDGVVAHLWLGKSSALMSPPPRLEEFCNFHAGLKPREIVVTHLEDLGREPEDYWTLAHYRQAARLIKKLAPAIDVSSARTGQRKLL
jgi:hypothetical protein